MPPPWRDPPYRQPPTKDYAALPRCTTTVTPWLPPRSAAAIDDLPVTVTAVTREDMDRRMPADEADLFRDDPDVAMARDLRRFGSTRVNASVASRTTASCRWSTAFMPARLLQRRRPGKPVTKSGATPSVMPDFLKQVRRPWSGFQPLRV
ncbi:MAG: hypothetical protein IPL58_15695 [Betaproteobacteria bacterium]|uniref:Uncharacterized protein n=1 Tax=Candidatus Proximibacter danicus TaxID=2954365 RepID=A0A9D7PRK4_9PROT|nr:hypothetical protein [Candidatus Proximibacter danicus]